MRYAFALLGTLGLFVWLYPIYRFGPFAFGYDTGLYRRYLLEPLTSFPNLPVPGLDHTIFLPRMVLDLARILAPGPDAALLGAHVVFSALGACAVYLFVRAYLSRLPSLIATALYLLSAVQFAAYHEFLFKQAVALPLLLLCLMSLERERYGRAATLGALIVLTHQTTSILLLVVAAAGFAARTVTTRTISLAYTFSGVAIGAMYLLLHPHVARKIASPPVGVFIEQFEYLLWSIPIFLLALIGLYKGVPLIRRNPVLLAALLVTTAFVVFHLPFYSRIYVFFDLFLVIPAALGAEFLLSRVSGTPGKIAAGALILAVAAIPLTHRFLTYQPALDQQTQSALARLSELSVNASVITSPALMPWVQGWSRTRAYAPGLLKEPHSVTEWALYWSHSSPRADAEFLRTFPPPAYIFARQIEHSFLAPCATAISTHLYAVEECL